MSVIPLDPVSAEAESVKQADRIRALYFRLGGPKPPENPLVRLMASAKGSLTDEQTDFAFTDRDRNERLKLVRLKSRRARELREAFA